MTNGQVAECYTAPPKHKTNRMLCTTYTLKVTRVNLKAFPIIENSCEIAGSDVYLFQVWTNVQQHIAYSLVPGVKEYTLIQGACDMTKVLANSLSMQS